MTATASRLVRVYLAMKDGPLPRSLKKSVSEVVGRSKVVFGDEMGTADVVVFSEVRDIERGYDAQKTYVFMRIDKDAQGLPKNCVSIHCTEIVAGLVKIIGKVSDSLQPIAEESEAETASIRKDALRILVIDDTSKHQASAKVGLAGHRLTVATGYEEAMNILGGEKFDVVLTDLHLPMSSKTMGANFRLGELVPYGILLMVEAAHRGAKFVAVVTDLNHHADPFSAAFDYYSSFSVKIEKAKVVMMHAPMKDDAKDWAEALKQLMKD